MYMSMQIQDLYQEIYTVNKKGLVEFNEKIHCPMVVRVMDTKGTMTAFCMEAKISDRTFYRWIHKFELFHECYRIGAMMARENWEREGEEGQYDESFDIELWKARGAARFGVGKTNRVRVNINAESNPYEQYKQLVSQASMGDFTASEFKQLVEGVNVGI